MSTAALTNAEAAEFVLAARAARFKIEVSRDVLTVSTKFTPADRDAYVEADCVAGSLLARAPMLYPGTVWGTDGASVGGHAGLTGGYYRLSKSGVGKRFLTAVRKAADL